MLSDFPQLLAYGFFAPTLLRAAAAFVFFYLAYYHFKHKEQIAHTRFPVVGEGVWIAWFAVAVEFSLAAALLLGWHTQVASAFGVVVAFKQLFWHGKYPGFFVFSRSTSFLLLAVCASLLVSGAGALAQDLPL
ncbi:hypothetical protein HYS79_00565 [Patescibacteria group bacterium]|nr:hypothetical protein [Patescibacteria group bacterium]